MKRRSTTPVFKGIITRSLVIAAIVTSLVVSPFALTNTARADEYDVRIAELQARIDAYQSAAGELAQQAKSLQNELALLDQQRAEIQTQIDLTQAKYDKLQADIKDTERQISENKDALGDTVADIYTENKVTPLEMLASSDTIADYVDAQAYRDTVRDELSSTIDRINALKKQLEEQQVAVERTLADQNNAKKALIDKENEKSAILAQTQSDEAAYQQLKSDAASQKEQAMKEQQAAIAARLAQSGGGGGMIAGGADGAYPWDNSTCPMWGMLSTGGANGNGGDGYGYGCRQCASYAAWRVAKETGYYPYGWGDARLFPSSARSAGFSTGYTPRAKSLGVIYDGSYGHVAWIEDVSGGQVRVQQYNYNYGAGWGMYSDVWWPSSMFQEYVYIR